MKKAWIDSWEWIHADDVSTYPTLHSHIHIWDSMGVLGDAAAAAGAIWRAHTESPVERRRLSAQCLVIRTRSERGKLGLPLKLEVARPM